MPTISSSRFGPLSTAVRRRLHGPILLATDGTAQSSGAFAAAVCIAAGDMRRTKREPKLPVRVITVSDALPIVPAEVAAAVPRHLIEGRRAEMLANARAQVRYNVADTSNWRVDVMSGPPAATIADVAAEIGASLVITGLGKHALVDRIFGSETALRVMRLSGVPVLAVPENWIGVPRRILVAVDFGPASLRAARTAMRIVPPGGAVCFAHVAPNIGLPDQDTTLAEIYQHSLNEEFDRFVGAVGVPDDVAVTRIPLYGDTARALLDWASAHSADLIVAGTHGINALARLFLGSVASTLVRGAQCAVLIASASHEPDETDAAGEVA